MRVSTLAVELGIDPKDIRKFLRSEYGRVAPGSRWDLNQEQIEQVRWRIGGREGQAIRRRAGPLIPPIVRRHSGPEIIDIVKELQFEPQDIHIEVVGSTEVLIFHRIMRYWSGSRGGSRSSGKPPVVLLSNGEFKESGSLPGIDPWYLESQYCLINRNGTYYAHHGNYVWALTEIQIPHWLVKQLIERKQTTGRDDTPQELLITEYSRFFDTKLCPSFILKWEHSTGKPIGQIQLKDLWGSYDEVGEVTSTRGYSLQPTDLRLAFSRYFATINLLKENPNHSEAFAITLGEIFHRFYIEVGKRAEDLRRDVAERYGFEAYGDGWRKSRGRNQVTISPDLRVHINGKFVCIVSAKTSQLPFDDEIARRMLAVATAHRDQIYTIKGDLKESLERLFPIGNGITQGGDNAAAHNS